MVGFGFESCLYLWCFGLLVGLHDLLISWVLVWCSSWMGVG